MSRVFACGLLALALGLAVRTQAPDDLDSLDQARQALYVVDAYREGRLLVPLEGGVIYPTKPPLMTWLSLGVAAVRGRVDELAARLPSAAATVVLLAATVRFARRLGRTAALTAAVAVVANHHVIHGAWLSRTDMLLAAFTTLAVAQTFESYMVHRQGGDPRRSFLAASALMGLGTVAKSPVALACPLFSLVFFLVAIGEGAPFARALGGKTLALAALVYAAIVGAWLLPAALVAGRPFVETIARELVGHAAGTGDYAGDNKIKPFYYPIAHILGSFQPWITIALLGAVAPLPTRPKTEQGLAAWFAVSAFLGTLAFFMCLRVKRADHVIPCYPWAAIAAGLAVERWLEEGRGLARAGFVASAALGGLAASLLPLALRGGALLPSAGRVGHLADTARPTLDALARHPALVVAASFALAPLSALLLGGVVRRSPGAFLAGTVGVVTTGLALYFLAASPMAEHEKAESVRRFGEVAHTLVGDEPVTFVHVPPSVTFYVGRSQPVHDETAAALEDVARGARAVLTDTETASEILRARPELALARTSGFYWKTTPTRDVWQLALLLPRERVKEPVDPSGVEARTWW
jgi:4-amino-4-deoxy-L-arabinose transferase-like glycosyltransferase